MKSKILMTIGIVLFLAGVVTIFETRGGRAVYADSDMTVDDSHEDDILTQSDLESDELEYDADPQAELDTVADDEPVSRANAEQARLEDEDDKLIDEFSD